MEKNFTGWWYQNADGSYLKNKWEKINGVWYYFNEKGYMLENEWAKDKFGKWYYLGSNGEMKTNSWVKDKTGVWYYVGTDGVMKTNSWEKDKNGAWYYVGANGAMKINGWAKDRFGKWYYLGTDGVMKINSWVKEINSSVDNAIYSDFRDYYDWYYVGKDGSMEFDVWVEDEEGYKYYLNEDGTMKKGGFVEYIGNKYFVDASGIMQSGVVKIKDEVYYFNQDGIMETGIVEIDGVKYTFDVSGKCIDERFPDTDKVFDYSGFNGKKPDSETEKPDGDVSEEITTEEITTKEVTTEEITTKEITTEEVTTKEVTTEEVTESAIEHNWKEATCTKAKVCTICGKTEGSALGHNWKDATCIAPKTCNTCGTTDGNPLGHISNMDDGNCLTAVTCQRCPEIMKEAQLSHTPSADDGNCETLIQCTTCGFIIVPAKVHDFTGEWENDTEGHWHKCKNDDCTITDSKIGHSGGEATCLQGINCTDCGIYIEKDVNNHASDKYTYISNGNTTHKKIHECNIVIDEETHIVNTSEEITYTWSDNYISCTAKGICSLCEENIIETVNSTDEEQCVSAEFTIMGFEKQYFNKTTITFNTDGGSDIAPIIQLMGSKVTPPTNPTKTGSKFIGWNEEIPTTMPSENITITAIWEPIPYTVIWVDENGTVLERDEGLFYGETPTYNGDEPYKSETAEYFYRFIGWTPSVRPVTGDTTYTAVYESTKIESLEGYNYKIGDVVKCSKSAVTYCEGCGKLLRSYTVTITGLRGILDGVPVYWVTRHCCGKKTSISEREIHENQ